MQKGELVRMPSSKTPWVLGFVEDPDTRLSEGLVGVVWPDASGKVKYERFLWLVSVDSSGDKRA